jgi:hypothetical protein
MGILRFAQNDNIERVCWASGGDRVACCIFGLPMDFLGAGDSAGRG